MRGRKSTRTSCFISGLLVVASRLSCKWAWPWTCGVYSIKLETFANFGGL